MGETGRRSWPMMDALKSGMLCRKRHLGRRPWREIPSRGEAVPVDSARREVMPWLAMPRESVPGDAVPGEAMAVEDAKARKSAPWESAPRLSVP